MIANEAAIREAISACVLETVGPRAVAKIDIAFVDEYEPMKEIIAIDVVLNGKADIKSLSGLGVKLRKMLLDLDNEWYPLLSFISKRDYARRGH